MRKWIIGIIAFILILFVYAAVTGVNKAKDDIDSGKANNTSEKEKPEDKPDEEPEQNESTVIEVNETVASVDYTAKIQHAKIDGSILTVVFDWENQSEWDPAHFPLLGYIVVEQDGKELKQIGDLDRQNKQIKQGRFDVYDLEYELIDDSDITIRIVSINEDDGSEGKTTVKID